MTRFFGRGGGGQKWTGHAAPPFRFKANTAYGLPEKPNHAGENASYLMLAVFQIKVYFVKLDP